MYVTGTRGAGAVVISGVGQLVAAGMEAGGLATSGGLDHRGFSSATATATTIMKRPTASQRPRVMPPFYPKSREACQPLAWSSIMERIRWSCLGTGLFFQTLEQLGCLLFAVADTAGPAQSFVPFDRTFDPSAGTDDRAVIAFAHPAADLGE